MNDLSDIIENRIIDWMTGVGTPTRPTTPLKVALFKTMPDQETGTGGDEVSGFGYARTTIVMDAASSGATSNTSDVTFPAASGGSWGTIVGVGVFDSVNLLLWTGLFTAPKIINDGETFRVPAGALQLELD